MREGAHPPDAAIRGWAKVRPFPFVSGILKRCFSWLEPENQSCSDSICNVPILRSSSINVRHCTWLGFFLPPAVRVSGGKNHLGGVGRCRIQHGAMPGRVGGKARKKLCASVTSLSRAVFNEREANESRLLYKKEQHGYNSHRIVCIRSRNCAATRLLGGYKMKCGTLAHPPDETIRGWAKVRPFPFVSGVLKRCFSWLDPENQS